MSADVVTTDKLDRINRALDDTKATVDQLVLKASRRSVAAAFRAQERRASTRRLRELYAPRRSSEFAPP